MSSESPSVLASASRLAAEQQLQSAPKVQGVHNAPAGLSSAGDQARQLDRQLQSLRQGMRESVEAANSRMQAQGRSLDVALDKQTNMVVVTVTDRESGQQVRQIPPESALNITRNIDRLTGILVDKKA